MTRNSPHSFSSVGQWPTPQARVAQGGSRISSHPLKGGPSTAGVQPMTNQAPGRNKEKWGLEPHYRRKVLSAFEGQTNGGERDNKGRI